MAGYAKYAPYTNPADNLLEMACQCSLFFALISKIGLEADAQGAELARQEQLQNFLLALLAFPLLLAGYQVYRTNC